MCPLTINTAAAAALLKKNPAEIMAMIESGKITWALNVSARDHGRRQIRIPTWSILAVADGQTFEPSAEELAARLFGGVPAKLGIPAPIFYSALGVSHGHFYNLVNHGKIQVLTPQHRGATGAAVIPFNGVVSFLNSRRIS